MPRKVKKEWCAVFRVDEEAMTHENLKKWLDNNCYEGGFIKEISYDKVTKKPNPHFHGWFRSKKSEHALRKSNRRAREILGNGAVAMKTLDESQLPGYFRYINKGVEADDYPDWCGYGYVLNYGMTEIDVIAYNQAYWKEFEQLQIKKANSCSQTVIMKMMKSSKFNIDPLHDNEIVIRGKILKFYHEQFKIYPNKYVFRGLTDWFVSAKQIHELPKDADLDKYYQDRAFQLYY